MIVHELAPGKVAMRTEYSVCSVRLASGQAAMKPYSRPSRCKAPVETLWKSRGIAQEEDDKRSYSRQIRGCGSFYI